MVHTVVQPIRNGNETGTLYYHLFESNKKNRRMEVKCTLWSVINLEDNAMRTTVYQETIYRWLKGRNDPEIPRYEDIPGEDVVNALRGRK